MSRISNEWVNLEMRRGMFKDKPSRSGRNWCFLCAFVFMSLWSVPVQEIVGVGKNIQKSNSGSSWENISVNLREALVNTNHNEVGNNKDM
ncbi:MAG: hypothetical protein OEX11_04315 [Nitrosomonas sp.]|nr:hypothetical protein [Nitrosomonas sp.]